VVTCFHALPLDNKAFFLERTAKALPQFLLDDRKEKKESFTKNLQADNDSYTHSLTKKATSRAINSKNNY
jgi:hypothetical protein